MAERRRHLRTALVTRIRISHPAIGAAVVSTRDVSDGGVFLVTGDLRMPPIGAVIEGQVQGPADDLPVVRMRIVRAESEGVGLAFCE